MDVSTCVAEAVATISGPTRDPKYNAVKSGARSERLWAELQDAKQAIVGQVERDLGLDRDGGAQTVLRLIGAYAEATLLRESQFQHLLNLGGPVTAKGKARVHLTAWATAVDREHRLATTIGLTRKPRRVATMKELLET